MADDSVMNNSVIGNGVKLLGEAFITPGSSLILDGRVGVGLLHGALGIAAMSFLGPVAGPIARLLIAANSYSNSVTRRNLLDVSVNADKADVESPVRMTPPEAPRTKAGSA